MLTCKNVLKKKYLKRFFLNNIDSPSLDSPFDLNLRVYSLLKFETRSSSKKSDSHSCRNIISDL